MHDELPDLIALTASGVTVLVEMGGGTLLPAIAHWGPELEGLDAADAAEIVAVTQTRRGKNEVDEPVRLALLPEQATGWTGRPGLVGSREGRMWSTRFVPTSARLDGEPITSAYVESGPGLLEVTSVDTEAELELVVRIEMLPPGVLRASATITNTGATSYGVDGVNVAFPIPARASEILDFAGRWGRERVPQRTYLRVGTHLREGRHGRTGADSAYLLHTGTPGFDFKEGAIYAVHTAWSGNHVHYAERIFDGQRVIGGGELLLPGEVRLATGESYDSPWVYAAYGVGLDDVARRFHRHLRARSERPVDTARPVTLNVWEAVYMDHDVDRLLGLATLAAQVGVERFVLDDGWFGARRTELAGLGDWVVSPDAWPDGLHPLVDHVRGLGMEFGLWFEPEMVNPDSDVARAHPEWIMAARSEWPKESRSQQVLNLGIPEAYEHVRSQMMAILETYDIGYLKWDHNRDLVEAGNQLDGGRPGVHEQTRAAYRLMDEIRAAHPGVEIESCSSGGARVDLAVLERTDRVWVSDCIDPLERQHQMRWTTQLIPPEYMGAHIASGHSHTTGRIHDLSFRAGTAIFGHLGIEWDLARASEIEMRDLGLWIDYYKSRRELLLGGDLVRMNTCDDHLFVHGVVAPDKRSAIFAMAVVGALDAAPGPRLRFRGLDPRTRYRITPHIIGTPPERLQTAPWWGEHDGTGLYEGAVLSGSALQYAGVAPPILRPDHVVLFEFTAV